MYKLTNIACSFIGKKQVWFDKKQISLPSIFPCKFISTQVNKYNPLISCKKQEWLTKIHGFLHSKYNFLHVLCRGALHKHDRLGYWGVSFPSDEPVVYRTQRYRHDVLGERPIQFQQFLRMPTVFHGIMLLLGMAYFGIMSTFSWTRNLLFKVSFLKCDSLCSFMPYTVSSLWQPFAC